MALIIISITLMTFWVREDAVGPLHSVRSVVETITAPIKNVGTIIGTPFRAFGDFVADVSNSSMSTDELVAQNEQLRSDLIRMEEYRQENERLSALLDLKDAYQLESVGARVIATGPDSWNRVLTINKGSASGLSVGMPVMSANGLIGQIESVSPNSAIVRLITDEKSGVSVFLQTSRAEGILTGSVDGVLSIEYIETDVEVAVGDPVITSGSGGVFPKGIPIGEVISVTQAPADVYKTIIVRPISKVSTYEEVLVITGSESAITSNSTSGTNAQESSAAEGANASGAQGGATQDGSGQDLGQDATPQGDDTQ